MDDQTFLRLGRQYGELLRRYAFATEDSEEEQQLTPKLLVAQDALHNAARQLVDPSALSAFDRTTRGPDTIPAPPSHEVLAEERAQSEFPAAAPVVEVLEPF